MIPATLRHQLARLRSRERLLDLAWGVARWLALSVGLLLLASLLDWAIDREMDTPVLLRDFLSYGQVAVAVAGLCWLVLRPLGRRRSDATLALRVEQKYPRLHDRLISAVQLNAPRAVTEGMSSQLIRLVTDEAVRMAEKLNFAGVADGWRLRWAGRVLLAVLVIGTLPFLLWPETAAALLARQLGEDRDIPRYVRIEPASAEVWPSGEKVRLRFKVTGKYLDEWVGAVRIYPTGLASERYPLELEPTWQAGDEQAMVVADLPPAAVDFTYTAWLGDGRTKRPAQIRYAPRPVVTQQMAWAQLPEYCGLRPDGTRYEILQSRGDVLGIAGSAAHVAVKVQKAIKSGVLEILGENLTVPPRKNEPGRNIENDQKAPAHG